MRKWICAQRLTHQAWSCIGEYAGGRSRFVDWQWVQASRRRGRPRAPSIKEPQSSHQAMSSQTWYAVGGSWGPTTVL